MNFCTRPPKGWLCTRHPSHIGPCAAWTTESLIHDALRYRFIRDDDQTFAVFMPRKHGHIAFNGEALDQQIDAACSAQETRLECPECFGDKTITMSDGSKRPCELCSAANR